MHGLSPVATSSKVLEYQEKLGFFQPNTASRLHVVHLSSASDKKLSFSPENFGFPGFSFGFCYKALTYRKPRGQNSEMIDHNILRFDAKCLDVKGIVVVLCQHLQPLCSGCRIADGDLFLNGLACFWVNMPPYRFPHCIGSSSLSGHFLDASISVG